MNPKLLVPKQKKMLDLNCIPTAFASKTGKKVSLEMDLRVKPFILRRRKVRLEMEAWLGLGYQTEKRQSINGPKAKGFGFQPG